MIEITFKAQWLFRRHADQIPQFEQRYFDFPATLSRIDFNLWSRRGPCSVRVEVLRLPLLCGNQIKALLIRFH